MAMDIPRACQDDRPDRKWEQEHHPLAEQRRDMVENVISKIGIHATEPGDPCGSGMHLHLSPALLDDDGHVDFGVLGVFFDMACSQAGLMSPFLHQDISVHRVDRPKGTKLLVDARLARRGGRSAVVLIDLHDELGVRVAYSCQQLRLASNAHEHDMDTVQAVRDEFFKLFDGVCRLPGRLHDTLGLSCDETTEGDAVWRMPLGPTSRNGFGGLHGGVAFSLVGDAAAGGAARLFGGAKTTSALIRYLAPGLVGPFRAEPLVMPQADGDAFVRVEVSDEGADDQLIIIGEVHVVTAR
jgi:uncharacterized protein (TIGR00369 family)